MSNLQSVFVSSTFIDLREHRAAINKALLDAGFHPVGMEHFMARAEDPVEACLDEVAESDLFVGVYAWRYGYIPSGSPVSITEQELLKAQELGKPCFCFFVDESQDWPERFRESGVSADLLKKLKTRIGAGKVVTWFTTPENLAIQVIASLHRHVVKADVTPERRRLLWLLEKVEGFWLQDILERLTPAARRISLEFEERPGAVEAPFAAAEELPAAPAPLSGKEILDLFLKRERSLLLLGGVGSGKRTTLLLLAQGLAARARKSPQEPIPVVLNLSSWSEQQLPLGEWLVQEITVRYQADEKWARSCLEEHRFLPLLDGLDEVEEECRPSCVAAINAWLPGNGMYGIAVCCRTEIYGELPRLRLRRAMLVQPLSSSQINEYVAAAGPVGETLKTALDGDEGLRELAQTPQLLSLMEQVCREEAGSEALTRSAGNPAEERRRKLLDTYVSIRLKRKPSTRYTPEQTLHALAWLAGRMKELGSSLFQLDQLQPEWLPNPAERWTYFLVTRALAGLLLVLPVALWQSSPLVALFGLVAGAGKILFDAVRLTTARTVVFGAAIFLLFLSGGIVLEARNAFLGAMLLALLFGWVLGPRYARSVRGHGDIRIESPFEWQGPSWSGAWKTGLAGALVFLVRAMADPLIRPGQALPDFQSGALGLSLFFLVGAFAGGTLGGLRRQAIAKKARSDEGMRMTLKRAGTSALFAALVTSICAAALSLLFTAIGWHHVLLWGVILALWIGLGLGGLDILQHVVLRVLLRRRGYAPAHYDRFLDYACDCGLLKRAGGSYLFYYDQPLLEHFASLPSPVPERSSAADKPDTPQIGR